MRWGLDLLLDQAEFVAVPGITRWLMDANWKFASDNAIGDMYHGHVTHRSPFLVGHTAANGTDSSTRIRVPGLDGGFTFIAAYGHGLTANLLVGSPVNMDAPGSAWRQDPAVIANLGELRSQVNRANMLVFPNLLVNSGSREVFVRNPAGPSRMEIRRTMLVDKNASSAVQREQVRASNRHLGPAGMFEQDDGENWHQSTVGTRGNVSRRRPLNYAMGLGHGEVIEDEQGPPRIDTLTNEHAQLWMYGAWAAFMDAPTWSELRATHEQPRGRIL
jgi:hypothetical protein